MRYAREPYSTELIAEMIPLWVRHHAEVAAYKDIELNPNFGVYETSDTLGGLRIFTVRHESGAMVGYQIFFVNAHPHTMQSVQAVQDILYLAPEARQGWEGYRFLRWCVEELKKESIDVIYAHIPAKNDFGPLLERMGYELVDLVYGLRRK